MSRPSILILLGILAILTPFSGLPAAMRTVLVVIFGGVVLGIGIAERSRAQRNAASPAQKPAASDSAQTISSI